jgi:cell division protein FtsW
LIRSALLRFFKQESVVPKRFDHALLGAATAILIFGLIMVASASMAISERQFGTPFHFFIRQLIYVALGIVVAFFSFRQGMLWWIKMGPYLLLLGLLLLFAVLIPHIGHVVNGSRRWIRLGFLNLQVSEFMKLAMVIFMGGFLVRRFTEVQTAFSGFLKPMVILGLTAVLLLAEPDFGATVVIAVTVMTMLFLAGVRLKPFFFLLVLVVIAFALLAVSAPYRMARLTTFLDPWANQYSSGYQLTQSLIAFGRGGFSGVGLGASIQKLFYLPEAHTDFLFAVLAEELGLIGILVLIGLYSLLVYRAFLIGRRAQGQGMHAEGYIAYGFGVWLAMQAVVNMGVTAGLLPTKGLTLPLMSYGGSSMIIDCIMIGLLLRIDVETRNTLIK